LEIRNCASQVNELTVLLEKYSLNVLFFEARNFGLIFVQMFKLYLLTSCDEGNSLVKHTFSTKPQL